ncbi:protein kinase PTK2 PWA37_002998 [Arxiozyma heterogenica]|uniref:protein kinase PTK2 n=1 Tax=Arxiozyma heterogenica TaxID=278026 RepID=UPI002F0F0410
MPTSSIASKDKDLHKSPSVLKLLGKRILNANKHPEPSYNVIASGNSIAPSRKKSFSSHAINSPNNNTSTQSHIPHGTSPTSNIGVSNLNSNSPISNVKRDAESTARHRSPSFVTRLRNANKEVNHVHVVHSSVALADLTAHNINPFVMTPLHDEKDTNTTTSDERPLTNRATVAEIHRAKSISTKKNPGAPYTHHLATPARSKTFVSHSNTTTTTTNNSNNNNNGKIMTCTSIHNLPSEKVIYNPYGINSRPGTAFGNEGKADDLSFYLHDGNSKIRMLPLPIEDPNSYLPDHMKQFSVHLTDNFVFDADNSPIGSGGSSEVRKIRSSYRQKDVYALKKLNMIYDETPEKFYKRCSKEFIIAKTLSNNIHIMPTFLLVKVPTTTYTTRGWGFVMELGVKDLFELIERTGWKAVPINEKWCLFKQVAQGVKFCHDNGIAHRDLKPENVLITRDGVCKLTDFGISDWYHTDPHDFSSPVKLCEGMIGSPPFTPPEVMYWDTKKHYPEKFQKPYNPLGMDCYALGIMLFTLINGTIPFIESCNTDARFREFEASYENYVSHQNPHFRDKNYYKPGPGSEFSLSRHFKSTNGTRIAWRLSDPNPETRYTLEDLFNDPWFQAVETCVDPDGANCTLTKVPEIRKATSADGTILTNENDSIITNSSTDDIGSTHTMKIQSPVAQHTSNPFFNMKQTTDNSSTTSPISNTNSSPQPPTIKPRSMVDIATSPMKPIKNVVKKSDSDSAKKKGGSNLSNEIQTSASAHPSRSSTTTPCSKDMLYSVPETELEHDITETTLINGGKGAVQDNNSKVNNQEDSVIGNRKTNLEAQKVDNIITENLNDLTLKSPGSGNSIGSEASSLAQTPVNSISSMSVARNGTPQKRRSVVHHHLDIPGSITTGTSMTLRSLISG